MLIKQSQDDGGDELTWRISPVNERLHAISKQLPGVMRVLADSSRLNSMSFHQCSENKASPASTGKFEKWLSSPPLLASENSLILSNRISFRNVNPEHDMELRGRPESVNDKNNSGLIKSQSPFKTPPSLSYCHDKGRDKDCILVSFVRSSKNPRNCISSLLGDWHRINVALTRAKKKLVMVGSCRTLAKVPLLKLLLEKVEEQSGILSVSKNDVNYKPELKRCSQIRQV